MVSAIVLAAGTSTRMKGNNKLLLPWMSATVIRETVKQVHDSGVMETLVITGHQSEKITVALEGVNVKCIYNPAFRSGMTGSIQSGVYAATGDAYMICLGDMVLVTSSEYQQLVDRAEQLVDSGEPFIVLPKYQKQKANPVIFSASFREQILAHPEPEGCKAIVEANSELISWVDMTKSNVLKDIDYREDYQKLLDERRSG